MVETRTNPTGNTAPEPTVPPPSIPDRTDPSRDGLVGIYALRILDRGVEPRTLVAAHRAIRYGLSGRPHQPFAAIEQPPIVAVARGAAISGQAPSPPVGAALFPGMAMTRTRPRRLALPSLAGLAHLFVGHHPVPTRPSRRLVTAGFAIATVLGFGAVGAFAEEQPIEQRTVVSVPRS